MTEDVKLSIWDLLIALSGLEDYAAHVNADGDIELERLEVLRLAKASEGSIWIRTQPSTAVN